jgi:hypothetical protein
MEGIESLLLQTFMDPFEDLSEIQVVDGCVELEPDEISGLEALHILENLPRVDLISKYDLEMALDGKEEIGHMDICKLILPNLHVEDLLGVAVEITPDSEGGLGISEDDVEETDHSLCFSLLLPLPLQLLVHAPSGQVLDVVPEVVLQAASDDVRS